MTHTLTTGGDSVPTMDLDPTQLATAATTSSPAMDLYVPLSSLIRGASKKGDLKYTLKAIKKKKHNKPYSPTHPVEDSTEGLRADCSTDCRVAPVPARFGAPLPIGRGEKPLTFNIQDQPGLVSSHQGSQSFVETLQSSSQLLSEHEILSLFQSTLTDVMPNLDNCMDYIDYGKGDEDTVGTW